MVGRRRIMIDRRRGSGREMPPTSPLLTLHRPSRLLLCVLFLFRPRLLLLLLIDVSPPPASALQGCAATHVGGLGEGLEDDGGQVGGCVDRYTQAL